MPRHELKVHPIAALFPMLADGELQALAADIRENGLQQAVVIQGGTLLDGRNRLAACELAGVEPTFQEYEGDNPTAFIISSNLHRRHLSESQRASIADRMANMRQGERTDLEPSPNSDDVSLQESADLMHVGRSTVADARFVRHKSPELADQVMAGEITVNAAKREIKRAESKAKLESIETKQAKELEGVYDVIVVDPPWPMQKIERDVRPNQTLMDYPVMEEDEMMALDIPAAEDCHLWLWTTHRFLPMAFRLLEAWEFKYVCAFVWHKPGGFQPVGLPQYNCEFSLYARKGSPIFTETTAFPVCFEAPRGAHSEKPEAFYDMVRRVTGGRRLDMFNRRPIEGFDTWGKEAE